MPAEAPGMDVHASRPKELPADRTAELCQAAAEELEKQGLNADAVAQYEKARRLDPKRGPVVARRLAVLYDRLGDDAHALADYKRRWRSPRTTPTCSTTSAITTTSAASWTRRRSASGRRWR